MNDLNVDDFFHDAARTLVTLYQVFPRRRAIFVEDVSGPEEPDEFGMHSDRYLACYSTLLWLGEERYLRFEETISHDAIDQAVLTGRCFTLLSSPPEDLPPPTAQPMPASVEEERSTHVAHLREALRARSSAAVRRVMLSLFQRMEAAR